MTAGVLGAVGRTLTSGPSYPPNAGDLATFDLVGLRLPRRATIAIAVMVFVVIFDFSRTFIPDELIQYDHNPGMQRLQAFDRLVLFLLVPLLVVVLGFRERPSRYGLRVGDWRVGLPLAIIGCAVMTPVVLWFADAARQPGLLRAQLVDAARRAGDERGRPDLRGVPLPRTS